MATLTVLDELEAALDDAIASYASSDGFVPASLIDLAAPPPPIAGAPAVAGEAAGSAALELLGRLSAFGAAIGIVDETGLGRMVAGADVSPDLTDGVNPYAIGTDQWYAWRAGIVGAPVIELPGGGREPIEGNEPYRRGRIARHVRDAARAVVAARSGAAAAPPERSHAGLALGALPFAGALVLFGLAHVLRTLIAAIGGIIATALDVVPGVGPNLSSGVTAAAHYVSSVLGEAAAGLDPLIAAYWNDLAKVSSSLWQEVAGGAAIAHTLARIAQAGASSDAARRPSPHAVGRLAAIAAAIAPAGEPRVRPLRARVAALEGRTAATGAQIAHAVGVAIPAELGSMRAQTAHLQAELEAERAQRAQLEKTITVAAGAGLVVGALRRIGAGWLQCRNWRNIGRGICGAPSHLIDDLLALALDFTALVSVCEVIPWLETAFAEVAGPLISTLARVGAGLCRPGHAPPPRMRVPDLALPSSPSLELHLEE